MFILQNKKKRNILKNVIEKIKLKKKHFFFLSKIKQSTAEWNIAYLFMKRDKQKKKRFVISFFQYHTRKWDERSPADAHYQNAMVCLYVVFSWAIGMQPIQYIPIHINRNIIRIVIQIKWIFIKWECDLNNFKILNIFGVG